MTTKRLAAVLAVAVLLIGTMIGAALLDPGRDDPEPAVAVATATSVPHFETATREVRITSDAQVSATNDPVIAQLESGTIPDDVTTLTVRTDENCQPDAEGVSHCVNRATYDTGSGPMEIVLRHHHDMAKVPCLAPGQVLQIVD